MKKLKNHLKSIAVCAVVLCCSFFISLIFQRVFDIQEHVSTVFIFAVFVISFLTDGYIYGIVSSFVATFAVNFAFTFPYFKFNFSLPVNLLSAIIMISVSVLTCALTAKAKHNESMKAEGEKERMRANLLRAISHDLRTPLTTIYGSASTLIESGETLTKTQQNKILQGIKQDSEWLVGMVENLLSITRIDSGKVKITKLPTVVDELIDSVLVKFKKRYPQQEIKLDLPDDIVIIPMDAMLIEQVIINILDNAVQHAKGMSRLSLRVFEIGKQAVFEIEDDGCGISDEKLGRMFKGYYEAKNAPADSKKRNAGIGLSVCATIIKAHGGTIKAENVKNGGAVFCFTLSTEDNENEQQI